MDNLFNGTVAILAAIEWGRTKRKENVTDSQQAEQVATIDCNADASKPLTYQIIELN